MLPSTIQPGSMADKPRLTEDEKKRNHIASEKKRREAIRQGFDRLASLVPGIEGQGRREAVVIHATVDYIKALRHEQQQLANALRAKGVEPTNISDLPDRYREMLYHSGGATTSSSDGDGGDGVVDSKYEAEYEAECDVERTDPTTHLLEEQAN